MRRVLGVLNAGWMLLTFPVGWLFFGRIHAWEMVKWSARGFRHPPIDNEHLLAKYN